MTVCVYAIDSITCWEGWSYIGDYGRRDGRPFEEVLDQLAAGMRMARGLGWNGSIQDGPWVAGFPIRGQELPGILIAWKHAKDGKTFVASPVPLLHLEGPADADACT